MYLKSLELQGFKSFPDKTTLRFDSGITVIVGPNGSGKSNLTDAMRWVLGELSSKNIRGSKMEDVVFVGTATRRPMSYAEVSVTFDNSTGAERLAAPYNEVTVTRRYYRSGESEYLINRKQVRLRDIYELFMNTGVGREGYSIIGQGRIAEIISKKSEDRRAIFEEAAGISRYRYKKQESERSLAEVEDNMTRAADILRELEARIGPLEKAAEKERRFLELSEQKKRADVSLWLYDTAKLRTEIEEAEKNCVISKHELEMAEDMLRSLESQDDKLAAASQENKLASEKLYGMIKAAAEKRATLDEAYRTAGGEAAYNTATLESEESALKRAETQRDEAITERDEKTAALERALAIRAEAEKAFAEVSEKRDVAAREKTEIDVEIEAAFTEKNKHEAALTDLRVRIDVLKKSSATEKERSESVKADIAKYEAVSAELAAKRDAAKKSADEYKAARESLAAEYAELTDAINDASAKRSQLEKKLSEATARSASLAERIGALRRLEEHFEGYNASVKYIMNKYRDGVVVENGAVRGELYGPVSRIITVPEKYTVAIETALGANMQNIVLENEDAAKACIAALKRDNAGRATFYPLTSVRGQPKTQEMLRAADKPGFIGYADEIISFDPKYGEVMSSMLGRTLVFEDLASATEAAKATGYRIRVVTLDGQLINAGGSFTGGSSRRDSGMLTRSAEIKRLETARAAADADADKLRAEIAAADKEAASAVSERKAISERAEMILTLERTETTNMQTAQAQLDVNEKLLADMRADAEKLVENDRRSGEDVARLEAERDAEIKAIKELNEKRERLSALSYEKEEVLERLKARQNEFAIRAAELRRDEEAVRNALAECEKRAAAAEADLAAHNEKIAALKNRIRELEETTAKNRAEAAELERESAELEVQRAKLESGGFEYEKKQSEVRVKLREANSRKETLLLAHTRAEAKKASLVETLEKYVTRIYDEYELTHTTAQALAYPPVDEKNRAETAAALARAKAKLKELGSVNIGSIDEYNEVKARYDKLDTQMKDLTASKSDLTAIINNLEEQMKKDFLEAFNKINDAFNTVFAELFGGGTAELSLTDPDNILTSGIEIKAAPPGKMIKNLMLLSGGEQAFVAIALLFAILKVNPTPFCIFDEIEAALDEVNVVRFAEYIKRYSADTQFIVITHRRGTMEAADTLYGVTMPTQGVSRVLAVDPNEVAEKSELLK